MDVDFARGFGRQDCMFLHKSFRIRTYVNSHKC